jgi:hypothetical protein
MLLVEFMTKLLFGFFPFIQTVMRRFYLKDFQLFYI